MFEKYSILFRHMARPQVADGRKANILNKQSRKAENGWSSSLGVGRGS
jgi:hypothetical protein